MTDTTTDPSWSDDTPPEDTDTTTEATTEPEVEPPEDKPGSEAARYRRQLRDTEDKVAVLTARVDGYQMAEAERLAATHLASPGDLWLLGTTLADLRDDAGELDPVKVEVTAEKIVTGRPGLRTTRVDLGQGRRGPLSTGSTSWSSVLRGA